MLPIDLTLFWADAVGPREIAGARTIGLQHELHVFRSLESPHHCCLVNTGPLKSDGFRANTVAPTEKCVGSIWRVRSNQANRIKDAISAEKVAGLRTDAKGKGHPCPFSLERE